MEKSVLCFDLGLNRPSLSRALPPGLQTTPFCLGPFHLDYRLPLFLSRALPPGLQTTPFCLGPFHLDYRLPLSVQGPSAWITDYPFLSRALPPGLQTTPFCLGPFHLNYRLPLSLSRARLLGRTTLLSVEGSSTCNKLPLSLFSSLLPGTVFLLFILGCILHIATLYLP